MARTAASAALMVVRAGMPFMTHFLRMVRGILLKGAPLESMWQEMAAIVAFTAAALMVSVFTFRKRLG